MMRTKPHQSAVHFSACYWHYQYNNYSRLSLNGHLYKMDTSVKRTLGVGPCLSLLPLFDSL